MVVKYLLAAVRCLNSDDGPGVPGRSDRALIRARRDGQSIIYSLNTSVVEDLTRLVLDIFEREESTTELRESQ
jgi:hypothetical protein